MTQTKTESPTEATTHLRAVNLREANDKVLDLGRRTSASLVDAYESTLSTFADYQEKFAEQVPVERVASFARAQAELTRGVAKAYSSSARELIK